jgi:hypothetical protein
MAYAEIARRLRASDEDGYRISPAKRHPLTYWSEELQHRRRTREREESRVAASTNTTYIETAQHVWSH